MTVASEALALGQVLEVSVEKLVAGGDGLARHQGVPIFVPLSAPGDRLRLEVVECRASYARGEIVEILAAGPDRRAPRCRHFGHCGGCSLQHMTDEAQVRWKVLAARESLERIGGLDLDVTQRVVVGDAWHYRLRSQMQLEGEPERASVGYFGRGSHELVQIEMCPVLAPPLEEFVLGLARQLQDRVPKRLDAALGDGGTLSCGPALPGLPRGSITRRVGEFDYEYDARTFFQAHAGLLPEFVEAVIGNDGDDDPGEEAYDLYAGVGLFALPLGRRYDRVVAVESDRSTLRYLRKNVLKARLSNVVEVGSVVESWIDSLPENADRVVVDPPRRGLSLQVRGALMRLRPKRLTYASCHAAALARDLKALAPAYAVESITYLDMFPQTGHLEIVVQLRLEGDPS